ncbi:hypothetical protein ACFW9O_06665 [Streptomyces sp. NPDC059499]|uniref:hypothetical protein n=1 Tax=Streptomyces sp. NPDC059499 TaxID=3346852 RepID=UPI003682DA3E
MGEELARAGGAAVLTECGRPSDGVSAEHAVGVDMDWFDLYDFLSDVFLRGVVSAALLEGGENADLLGRSFDFVEMLLRNSNESTF